MKKFKLLIFLSFLLCSIFLFNHSFKTKADEISPPINVVYAGERPITIMGISGTYNYTLLSIFETRQAELIFNFPMSLINQGISIESIKIENVTSGVNYTDFKPSIEYHPNPRFIWLFDDDFFQEGKNTIWLYGINIKVNGVDQTIDRTTRLDILAINNQLYTALYDEAESHVFKDAFDNGYELGYGNGYDDAYDLAYDLGYEKGHEEGKDEGMLISQGEAYEDGYKKGSTESFLANFDKWIVPAIIVIMLLGGYFAVRRQKQEAL